MKIVARQEVLNHKVFVNIVLTEDEVGKLVDGKVVNGELPDVAIQIVGYGEESNLVRNINHRT